MHPSVSSPEARADRRTPVALGYCFVLNGIVFGSWAARLADVKDRLDASPGPLGAAMLGTGIGSMIATGVAPAIIRRIGSRPVLITAGSLACVLLIAAAAAPNLLVLTPILFALGMCGGAMAIGFSAEAVAYEQRVGRPIVNRFHGYYSAGGLLGAVIGAAVALTLTPLAHLTVVALLTLAGLAVVARWLPGRPGQPGRATDEQDGLAVSSLLNRRLAIISTMAWCAAFAESSVVAWSAVHLRDGLGASSAVAALGFAAMSAAMVVVRLSGSSILTRWPAPRVLRTAATLAAVGAAAIAFGTIAFVVIVGCALVGGGLALVFPTATATAQLSQHTAVRGIRMPSDAFAIAVLIGGAGAQLSGPFLGAVAEVSSLRLSFALVMVACVVIAIAAPRLPQARSAVVPDVDAELAPVAPVADRITVAA